MEKQPGMVSFVGAGPGDPELLTLKGKRLIEEAALLLYAGSMIPPALLDLASPRASVIDAAPLDLEECHSLMLQFARAGQPVVHLHTGDPAVYSALREQLSPGRWCPVSRPPAPPLPLPDAASPCPAPPRA